MTSNVGATLLKKQNTMGFGAPDEGNVKGYDKMVETIQGRLKETFRPEFLNRIDEIIVFKYLEKEQVKEIVKLMLRDLQTRLEDNDFSVTFADAVVDYIGKEGFDEEYGARPLVRSIRKNIEDRLADEILSGKVHKEKAIHIDVEEDGLTFEEEKVAETVGNEA